MEVIILEDSHAVATLSAQRISDLINKKPTAVLGLATGSTPIALYQKLISLYQQGTLSFRHVVTFNLDEYIGISPNNPQSYHAFMKRELFDSIDIQPHNSHLPTCERAGETSCQVGAAYEQAIAEAGGIDLQILGIGSNGHIGFNEPSSSLVSRTRVKTLTQATVNDNNRLFEEGEFQPRLAMTMGIASILDSQQVILLATGAQKARAVCNAIEGPLSAMCPASALQLHKQVTFILDEAAASKLENHHYYRWVRRINESLEKN